MAKPKKCSVLDEALAFRAPLRVSAVRAIRLSSLLTSFPVCPRCQCTLDREYQLYCDRCGQALDWKHFNKAIVILKD